MDYQAVYEAFIIDRRVNQPKLGDRHHIIPRCLGGGNETGNLVLLTSADHLFAHVLLAKIHGGVLVTSACRMAGMMKYRGRKPRERYQRLRDQQRVLMRELALSERAARSKRMKGNSHCVGRKLSYETKAKQAASWTDERRSAAVKRFTGDSNPAKRPEVRRKISLSKTGNIG